MLFVKKVGTKVTTVLAIASLMTQAQSVLHELNLLTPSIEQLAVAVRNNHCSLQNECTALEFTCNFWHEKTYDEQAWLEIIQHFVSLAHACKENEKHKNDTQWLTLLGEPTQSLLALKTPDDDIHRLVTVNTHDNEKAELTVRMWRENPDKKNSCICACPCECNLTNGIKSPCSCASAQCTCAPSCSCTTSKNLAWQKTLKTFITFMHECSQKSEAEALNSWGPVIKDTITKAKGSSGIHGELKACISNKDNTHLQLTQGLHEEKNE
ncbi:hypothetical protein CVU75_03185 [Candidatus Dependentiae bacterium HGW-Dependentiae-1]|nr:MAG: hypothetical protein CVU75_03185 [Candidatus Dependentiae bacterium HGW-Dependentiae-1]